MFWPCNSPEACHVRICSISAFPTPHLSSVIVSSFLWFLYINYAYFTVTCGRISAAFCPNTAFGIFFLFSSAFSVLPFLMLLICSVWASLSYFLLGCFFIPLYCSRHYVLPCHVLLLSILRFSWSPGFRSSWLLMLFFMMLQGRYLVNGHILCVLTYWMYFVCQGCSPD